MMNRPCGREQMLTKLNEHSFAKDDLLLYLDSHPDDENALAELRKHVEERNRLLKEYAQNFGPLTIDTTDYVSSNSWEWVNQPWPWEPKGGCN